VESFVRPRDSRRSDLAPAAQVLAAAGFGEEPIRGVAHNLRRPCRDGQCHCRPNSLEHAARALPRVRRRPPTLRALELEEPFPIRPTADVLCRLGDTGAMTPTISSATAPFRLRLERAFRARSVHTRLDHLGQGCATSPRVRGCGAHNPERLESYRSRLSHLNRPMHLGLALPPETRHSTHPFARLLPRGCVNNPSATTELDQIPTRAPCGLEPSLARDASGQLVHPTLSKKSTRAPRGYRLARSSSMRLCASRREPRFGRLARGAGPDGVDARIHAVSGSTSDARVASRFPRR
jgi:hypothetical protein